jgi:hypothetical protein
MKIEIIKGVVLKDGDEIGYLQEGICYLSAPVGPTVKGAIRKASGIAELQFSVGESRDDEGLAKLNKFTQEVAEKHEQAKASPDTSKPSLADMSDDELAAEMQRRGLIQEAPQVPETPVVVQPPVIERDLSAVERLHRLADEGKIPQPPEKHPAMGDKDPAYVAWFKQHATPAEIATRYPDNRRVPATVHEFVKAEEKLKGKLPGEVKDTEKSNDFANVKEGA